MLQEILLRIHIHITGFLSPDVTSLVKVFFHQNIFVYNFRCSAVFGGIYCLKRQTHSIALDANGQAIGIYSQDQLLKSPFIVLEESLNPKAVIKPGISRAILVTDK